MSGEHPVIIKKKKRAEHHGHHGGAWKVAYADFVTAMMAFFLVMWILGLSPDNRQRIASFFREPGLFSFLTGKKIPIDQNLIAGSYGTRGNNPGVQDSYIESQRRWEQALYDTLQRYIRERAVQDSIAAAKKLQEAAEAIKAKLAELSNDSRYRELLQNVELTLTPEGLRIELLETKESVFFEVGSARLRPAAVRLLQEITPILRQLPNPVIVEGHTDSRPYANSHHYSNWELSAERANSARKVLEASGLQPGRISGVHGYADRRLRNPLNPFDLVNRRVSIVVANFRSEDFLRQYTQPVLH
ncbi:MAG: flagellar motor protein MotB [Bacteroidota bacterium]|nr:OmpA family protein [Candidatus Kapabacteria bacterium]MCS7302266.1 OmpA family protein [Candidatus Kapabacteria bacterium]MCX7936275.1 OmpA family protein [Chlorobiota bacterium]MDW8074444.1 flagellar motor protein MotB [Bacteroidota bacterium]MDW8271080.1 flagellar motor protein MotB [Bacteroidota bacterium]